MSDLTDTWRGRITDIGRMDSDTYFLGIAYAPSAVRIHVTRAADGSRLRTRRWRVGCPSIGSACSSG